MSATINVVPVNDFAVNAARTVIMTIPSSPPDYTTNAATETATVNIADDDNLFTIASSGTPTENGATATFTFTRATSSVGDIVVNFTVGGTATLTTHYTVGGATSYTATTGTVTILNGQNTATLTVTPINDFTINAARTVILTVVPSGVPNYTIGAANSATATIADFVTNITIAAGVNAREGTPAVNGTFTFTLGTAAPAGGLVVNYTMSGTATSPANYSLTAGTNIAAITATTFTIAAGQTTATVNVVPINDFAINGATPTIIMTLGANPTYNIVGLADATVNLLDDNNLVTVTAAGSPSENGTTGTFTFTRATSTTGNLVVHFTVGGAAAFPAKYSVSGATSYTATTGTITILNGQTSAILTIIPINDFITSPPSRDVTVSLVAATPTPTYTIAATNNSALLNIADVATDIGVTLGNNAQEGTPAVDGVFTFTLSQAAPAGGLTVNYTLGGTATLTTHYTVAAGTNASSLTATTFVIAAGATSATLRIVPINNYAENATRTVICNIGAGSYNIATGAATLNINDDNLRVSLASSGTPSENGATGTFTFTRTNTSGLLLVPFTVGGTATYNTHYTITTTSPSSYSATNGTIVFADGQVSVTITINPINDNLINAARSVTLTLSNNMTFTVADAPNNSATLNITDATSPEVSIGFLGAPNEAGTAGAFVFSRTASTALALTVRFTLTGTATIGTNYTITNATLVSGSTYEVTIPAGSATRNVIINPSNDFTLTPGGRTVIATAITFMPQAYNLSPTAFTETLTIADDPNPITLTVSPTNIAENGGSFVTYTFSRGAATTGNLFVNFNVNGTAIYNAAGSSQPNYFQSTFFPLSWNVANGATTGNGFIVIPNGQTSASFRVHPVDDGLASGDKTVTVALNSGSYTVSATNSATATILDASSSPLVGISATSPIVDGGNSTITITRGGNFPFPVTVNFSVLGITLGTYNLTDISAGGDITGFTFNAVTGTGSFTFTAVPTTAKVATLNLNVLNDYIASNTPRNAVIQLTSASFTIPAIGTFPLTLNPSNATVVVNDDPNPIAVQKISDADEANPAVGIIRFGRGAVTAGVTVVRFGIDRNNGNSTLATHYTVSGATFLSSDANYHYYTANIPNGSTTTDVNITGINDLVISPARFARIVVLQNIPNYTVALSPSNTTDVNITEDPNVVGITVPASPQASEVGPTSGIFTISRNIATASPLVVDFDIDNVGLTNPAALTTHYTVTTQAGLTYTGTGGSVTIPAGATSVNITINPINDFATTTPDRQFRLRLKPSANYRIGTTATNAVMTITDDSSIISIQKIGTDPTKSGSVVGKFRVSRSSFVGRPAQTIAFTVAGTATFSAHYSQVGAASYNTLNGQITIPAGVASADIDITAVNDFAIQTMPRNIQIALSSGSYIVSTTLNTATMDIIDNNNIVSIVADAPNTPAEAGAMGTPVATSFTFTRTNGSNVNPLNVNFAITGSAIATTHYTLSGASVILSGTSQGTITIPAGQNSVVLTLTPINDFTVNANRNVFFTLTSTTPQSYSITNTSANSATCEIADDRNEVSIAVATTIPAEADASGMPIATTFTFTRANGSNISPLNVDFSIGGDAIVGTHYTLSGGMISLSGTTQGTVTILGGQNSVVLTLTPINDFLVNANRNVVFTILQKTPQTYTVAVAPGNRASTSIIDDNNIVAIAPAMTNTPAEAGMDGLPVATSFTFTRTNGSVIAPLNIDFAISGDAVVGTHYTLSGANIVLSGTTQGTVTIQAGQNSVTLTLTPINDFIVNPNRNAVFTILQKTLQTYTVAASPNNRASCSIIDDNNTISITPIIPNAPAEAGMDGLPVATSFTFTRANGSIIADLNVNFSIAGNAVVNTHYTLSGANVMVTGTTLGTVTIPAGQASVTLILTPINDFVVNPNRNASFSILQKNPQTYSISPAPNNSVNTTIADDNNIVSVIAVMPNMPMESGADNNPVATSFTFTRANGSTITALQVDFSLGGSAVANTHYTLSGGGVSVNTTNTQATITIPAGQNSVTVILTPINDFQINTNRNVVFSLLTKNPQTYTVATGMAAAASTVIINDPNTVSITSAGTPTEDMQTATFTFTRSDNKTTPLTVAFTVGGTATFGTHYTVTGAASYNATSGTIIIPANQTSATLTITTINDFITNPNRTVILTVVNTTPAASYIVATPPNNQVAVTIVDDVNAVRITQTGIANESGTTAKFTISRNTASASPLTVNFDVLGTSTATLATHYTVTGAATYTATNGTATIPAGATSVDITITPIDDNIINVSRNIILQLTLTTPLTYQLSAVTSETTATVIIANDDPQVTVALGNNAEETNRIAGKFMLNFNAAPTANTTINYTLTGTAAGTRYAVSGGANIVGTPTTTSAVVAAGSTTAELIITPIDNLTIDPSQTIILTLQPSTVAPTPDYFINTATPATMQIVDNDVTVACGTPVATTWTGVQTANLNYTANTAGQAIEFSITNINLAGTDKISIYNGAAFPTDNAQLIAEFTGNTVPPIFTSIAETISVVITQADAGSTVNYSINCVPQTPKVNCGSPTATLYSIGSITTPYAPNSRIIRTFQSSSFAGVNGAISATFNRFDVEASYDFIRVYDGLDTLAPLLGEFHNNQLPTQTLQTSLGNTAGALTFYFRSDGTVERAGFEVAMTCGTTVVAPTVFDPDVFALTELENAYGMGWDLMNPTNIDGVVWNQEPVRRVVSINLSGRGLIGDLPPDFAFVTADDGRMARLQSLDLSNNGITGQIPATFGRLKVTNLNLSNNSLEGGIPFEFQNLSNLVTLNLSSNFLNDDTNFDALEFLQYLATVDLSNNQFNAPLPISLLNIPQLSNLNLSVNQFSGSLPKELRDMRSIKVLNLSGNNLTGTMTVNGAGLSLFDSQFFLEDLNLSRNQLTGKIPGDMTRTLKFLNLSDNKFTGNLDSLYFLSGLINLELQKNELAGNLPANLHEISFAVNINLANNKFTGTIPSWSKFALIRTLDLSFNQLSGAVPTSLNTVTSLTTLALNDNQLRDLPTLTALTNIKSLNVYNNRLTFEDLEPNVSIPNFNAAAYSPQAAINDTVRISTSIGALITMKTNTAGTANLYRWKKGNLPIKSQAVLNDSIYAITSVVIEDAGLYSCDVTSNIVKGLTIVRNPIILNVGNPRVNVTDSLALVALYRSAGGRNWDNRWDLLLPVRTWYGVTLDIDRVIFLRLNDNKLEGTITDSLRLLSRLEELNLRKNRLSSKIPTELGQLTNLVRFDLSGNRLTSEIPTTLGTLAKLTYMDLSENLLEGTIPTTLTSLSKLKTLLLNDNAFSAMPNFTSITTLERLGVENNRLTFGDFEPNQSLISKTNFRFTYSPQAQINDARTIQAVFATPLTLNTQTSGTANTYQWLKSNVVIANAPNNTNFRINSLSYSDSGAYTCRVTNMLVPNLTLVRRALTVVVNPPALLATDSLALVDLYNSTNGANWDKKWDLTQPMDTWFGVVLDKSIGRVIRLLLSNNRLSGRISTSIGNLTKLKELNIRANPDLNGTIPTTIGNLIELEDLNLRGNRLTGTIPTELGKLLNLKTLALDNNQLSGIIPSALGSLQNLSVLFLNNNRLTGSLPNEINNLRLLQELYLNDNLLDRLIALPNLSVLGTLTVQNNNLGFESLESLIRIASFQYSPQLPRPAFDSTFISGRNYSLNTRAGGTQNRYLWKNDLNNQTVTTPIYSFTNILPQSTGRYTCDVTSAIVPNLTITYTYNIRVVPDVPRVTVPLPYCIGNNSVTLTVQDPVQAPFTQWIYFNTDKNRYDTLSPLQRSLTYKPRTTIGVDTVYATTIVRNVPSSSTNRILLYLRPEIRNINGVLTVIDNNAPNNKYQWLLFESPLQGATAKTLTPTQRGLYRVNLITEDGCSASSDTLRFGTVTSTEDQVLKNNLTISPNPTSDNLELVLDNDYVGNTEIVITDVLGRVIWQQKTEKFEVKLAKTIAVENWASGTYYLKLQTNKGFAVKRFVKQ
jgi:Leucine-rich repeat (LRR) protein